MAAEHGQGQMPLAGVVLCCTSITPERRHELSLIAENLGAEHKYDLTSDVTHLIIGNVDTAKYHYVARERPDVKVLLPSFIEAVRDCWKAAEDADVEALETEHRAPTFYGLKICLTGFDDLQRRQELTRLIEGNGAEYHGDLTKHVTHLVAATTEGKKYEYARRWQIKVVSERWLHDCVERGMVLNEALYDMTIAADEQGKGAWNRTALETRVLGKRRRDDDEVKPSAGQKKRKIRRTLSAKFGSHEDQFWDDIRGASGTNKTPVDAGPQFENYQINAVQPDDRPQDNELGPALEEQDSTEATVVQHPTAPPPRQTGIFAGAAVYIHGFSLQKTALLKSYLEPNGARMVVDPGEAVIEVEDTPADGEPLVQKFLVVPHDLPGDEIQPIPTAAEHYTRVTEWWVENCVYSKTMVDPDTDRFCRPFTHLAINGFQDLVVCCTNFKDMDLLHFSKTIALMGGTFEEYLRKERTSVLVCRTPIVSEKLAFAMNEEIPVVTLDWLWDSIAAGSLQPFEQYPVKPNAGVSASASSAGNRAKPSAATKLDVPKSRNISLQAANTSKKLARGRNAVLELSAHAPPKAVPPRELRPLRELSRKQINAPSPSPPKRMQSPEGTKENDEPELPEPIVGGFDGAASEPSSATAQPDNVGKTEALESGIQLLIAAKDASLRRTTSAPDALTARRRHRLLGRAASNVSNSTSSAVSLDPSLSAPPARTEEETQTASQSPRLWLHQTQNEPKHAGFEDLLPSQKIIYADAEMQDRREQMIKKLGGGDDAESHARKPASADVRTVQDIVQDTSIAGRVRRRKL